MGKVLPQGKSGKGFKIPGKVLEWQIQSWKGEERKGKGKLSVPPNNFGCDLLKRFVKIQIPMSFYFLRIFMKKCTVSRLWTEIIICYVCLVSTSTYSCENKKRKQCSKYYRLYSFSMHNDFVRTLYNVHR